MAKEPAMVVTHFPIQVSYAKLISRFCKYLFLGHWHWAVDSEWFGMRVINPGSDYGVPLYRILEIGGRP